MPGDFVRTERTWLAYGALASYAYCLYGLGPVLAFLHADLHLSYTVTSVHSTLWAAGTVATGVSYPWLSRRFGRRRVFWSAAAAFAAGALLLVAGYQLAATLAAAAVLGAAGTSVLTATTGILADEHGPLRARALIEANVGASASAVLAPLVIGGLAATGAGWRAGMAVPVAAIAALRLRFRRLPLASTGAHAGPVPAGRLPGACWMALTLLAVVVSIEFCLVFDAALLLHAHTGLSTQHASAALSVFYAGELAGRLGGSQLARVAQALPSSGPPARPALPSPGSASPVSASRTCTRSASPWRWRPRPAAPTRPQDGRSSPSAAPSSPVRSHSAPSPTGPAWSTPT